MLLLHVRVARSTSLKHGYMKFDQIICSAWTRIHTQRLKMAEVLKSSSIQTTILDIPPSCIEVCPWDSSLVAVGTYLLHKGKEPGNFEEEGVKSVPQERTGSVLLFRIGEDQSSLTPLHTRACDYAILDLHWPQQQAFHKATVWTANSTGSLTSHELNDDSTKVKKSTTMFLWAADILVLSFTWHPKDEFLLGATLSNGAVVLCQVSPSGSNAWPLLEVGKHELEAWTMNFGLEAAFVEQSAESAYTKCLSGGDDAVLQCIHVNTAEVYSKSAKREKQTPPIAVYKNRRMHQAGVTVILPLEADILLTGSYDDHLRVISSSKPPRVLAEVNLEGGVWRLQITANHKTDSIRQYDILASCMHAGVRIVRIVLQDDKEPSIAVLVKFEEHESMNYGSDFVRAKDSAYDYTILSTSFYDKRLCLWKFSAPPFDKGKSAIP